MISPVLPAIEAKTGAAPASDGPLAEGSTAFADLLYTHTGQNIPPAVNTDAVMPPLANGLPDVADNATMPEDLALESAQAAQLQQWFSQQNPDVTPVTDARNALTTRVAAEGAENAVNAGNAGNAGNAADFMSLKADASVPLTAALSTPVVSMSESLAQVKSQSPTAGTLIPALASSALKREKKEPVDDAPLLTKTDAIQAEIAGKKEMTAETAQAVSQVQSVAILHDGTSQEASPLNAALLRLVPEGSIATHANALATASSHAAPVLSQPLGSAAWQQALGQQVAMFTRNGIQNAELRLHPQELGALQLNIRMSQEQAQLHIVSDNHHVRAALEAAMPQLRASLAEAGIELNQSSVSADNAAPWQASFDQQQNEGGQTGGSGNGSHGPEDAGALDGENMAVETRIVARPGGVDTFA